MQLNEMLSKFDLFVESLRKDSSLHLKVKIYKNDTQISCETGLHFPQRLSVKVFDIAEKVGIKYNDISMYAEGCADVQTLKSSSIGKPKLNWKIK